MIQTHWALDLCFDIECKYLPLLPGLYVSENNVNFMFAEIWLLRSDAVHSRFIYRKLQTKLFIKNHGDSFAQKSNGTISQRWHQHTKKKTMRWFTMKFDQHCPYFKSKQRHFTIKQRQCIAARIFQKLFPVFFKQKSNQKFVFIHFVWHWLQLHFMLAISACMCQTTHILQCETLIRELVACLLIEFFFVS